MVTKIWVRMSTTNNINWVQFKIQSNLRQKKTKQNKTKKQNKKQKQKKKRGLWMRVH